MDYRFLLAALGLVTCVQVAWADDSPAIQSKLNACYAGTGSCNIDFQGARKTIGATLKVDPEYVTLRNAVFDCVMTSGTASTFRRKGFLTPAIPVPTAWKVLQFMAANPSTESP